MIARRRCVLELGPQIPAGVCLRVRIAGIMLPVDPGQRMGASRCRRGTGRSYRSVVLVPFHPLRRRMVPLIWLNGSFWLSAYRWGMKPPEEPRPGKVERPPKLRRSEDARRIIQEYIDNLREIIQKFRRRLN